MRMLCAGVRWLRAYSLVRGRSREAASIVRFAVAWLHGRIASSQRTPVLLTEHVAHVRVMLILLRMRLRKIYVIQLRRGW